MNDAVSDRDVIGGSAVSGRLFRLELPWKGRVLGKIASVAGASLERLTALSGINDIYRRASRGGECSRGFLAEVIKDLRVSCDVSSEDLERFDSHYLHLMVWNRQRRELVGSYRLGRTDQILAERGVAGLYTHELFEYQRGMLEKLGPALEMGRSFIRAEYQRSFTPLLLLWKGIGKFLVEHLVNAERRMTERYLGKEGLGRYLGFHGKGF